MTVPGVYSPEQLQAHVDKVIASDGVDDGRAVEVMALALKTIASTQRETFPNAAAHSSWCQRVAFDALKGMEE